MSPIQKAIAEIAYAAAHNNKTMKMSDLAKELQSRGFPSSNNRGLIKQVSSTYKRALEEGNLGVAKNIADVFTDNKGNHYWDK